MPTIDDAHHEDAVFFYVVGIADLSVFRKGGKVLERTLELRDVGSDVPRIIANGLSVILWPIFWVRFKFPHSIVYFFYQHSCISFFIALPRGAAFNFSFEVMQCQQPQIRLGLRARRRQRARLEPLISRAFLAHLLRPSVELVWHAH